MSFAEKYDKTKAAKDEKVPRSCLKDLMKQKHSKHNRNRLMLCRRANDFKVQDVLCMTRISSRSSSPATSKKILCQSNNDSERSAHICNR